MDDWSTFKKFRWGLVDIPICFLLGTVAWTLIRGGSIITELLSSLGYLAVCYLVYFFYRFYIKKDFAGLSDTESEKDTNSQSSHVSKERQTN